MTKKDRNRLKAKLDRLWSEAVKKRAGGMCERCGAKGVNAHHIIGRARSLRLRHDLANGILLCFNHHYLGAHQNSVEFSQWLVKKRGQGWWDALCARQNDKSKVDLKLVEIYLEQNN